jgi:hypothetical protein
MKKAGALASALRSSGATVASSAAAHEPPPPAPSAPALVEQAGAVQPSRLGTKAITVHFPEEVRRQLKTLAAEQGRNIEDMVAEALNLLFAKYRKAELAPRKIHKGQV